MKKFLWIFSSALLLSVAVLSTGCGEDEGGTGKLPPVVTLVDGPTPATVVAESETEIFVTVTATKGTDVLKTVTVYEGTEKVPLDEITYDGVDAVGNPQSFSNATDVMTWEIGIHVHADAGDAGYHKPVLARGRPRVAGHG